MVWDDPAFVDTFGGAFSESDTIQASLVSLGHTVSTFTGTSAAAWSSALSGASLLVIPETELSGSTFTALSSGSAATALAAFVSGGGGLITSLDLASLSASDSILNGVFGFGLTGTPSGPTSLTPATVGTPFAGGPAGLPASNATVTYTLGSLPGGATSIYDDGIASSVVLLPFGAGTVVGTGLMHHHWEQPTVAGSPSWEAP